MWKTRFGLNRSVKVREVMGEDRYMQRNKRHRVDIEAVIQENSRLNESYPLGKRTNICYVAQCIFCDYVLGKIAGEGQNSIYNF